MKISISALSIAYGLTPEVFAIMRKRGCSRRIEPLPAAFGVSPSRTCSGWASSKASSGRVFRLVEIKRIMTNCPLAELVAMMDEKRAALREQIAQQNAVYERMTCGTDLLRDCYRLSMQPRLCAGSAGYLIDFDSVSALWASVPKLPILKALIDALPLTSYCTIIPPALLTGGSAAARVGIVAPAEFMHVIHADFSQMRLSAGPQTVRTIFELRPPEESSLQPIVELNREFLQAHHLTPVCEATRASMRGLWTTTDKCAIIPS